MNKNKVIIDLCAGTGGWSHYYTENGYDVRTVTYPNQDVFLYEDYKKDVERIHGILAAPTCTQFSLARTTAKTPRDLEEGFKLVHSCLEIIWYCRFHGNLKFWALENPMGYLRQLLGKPPLTYNPNEYAGYLKDPSEDCYTKKTDIWGYFNIPKQKKVELTEEQIELCKVNNRKLPEIPKDYVKPSDISPLAVRRSITPRGFALAFYRSNK